LALKLFIVYHTLVCQLCNNEATTNFHYWFFIYIKNVKAQNFYKLRGSVTNKEQRALIKLNVLLERTPMAVANDLALILPDTHMSKTQVYTWYDDFKQEKRIELEDLPRPGRPRETTDEAHKKWVKELILESEGMTTQDLIYETDIPETSLRRLLKEIGARKIMSRWVPHELTPQQMQAHHAIAGKHLARYQRELGFLNKIVAIDETWVK
jgi:transposase